jgi:2-oxoglutarate ferredoxin oxidoreductase subunit delta
MLEGVVRVMAKGRITVLEEYCKSCGLCVAACPVKVLRISERINDRGHRPCEQYKEGCIGCGMCAMSCPDAAIEVYRIED